VPPELYNEVWYHDPLEAPDDKDIATLVSITTAPWLNKGSMKATWGLYCPMCSFKFEERQAEREGKAIDVDRLLWFIGQRMYERGQLEEHMKAQHAEQYTLLMKAETSS